MVAHHNKTQPWQSTKVCILPRTAYVNKGLSKSESSKIQTITLICDNTVPHERSPHLSWNIVTVSFPTKSEKATIHWTPFTQRHHNAASFDYTTKEFHAPSKQGLTGQVYIYNKKLQQTAKKYIRAKDIQVCLMIFHQNSNMLNLSFFSHSYLNQPIATKFFTWHTRDSYAVVACAKFVVVWWSEIKLQQN